VSPIIERDETVRFEYRVGARDNGDVADYNGDVYATLADAQAAVAITSAAEPPYDDVWIERRPVVSWERVAVDPLDAELQQVRAARQIRP
jgi:hypothetical protein